MRDPDRIDRIIRLISDEWRSSPDMRFMQLVTHLYAPLPAGISGDWFYTEDDLLEAHLLDRAKSQ